MREKIASAREKLESVLVSGFVEGLCRCLRVHQDTAANEEEKNKAMDILIKAKEAQKDDPVG